MENSVSTNPSDAQEPPDGRERRAVLRLTVTRYEGESCEGQPHGEGVAHFQGGHTYKGTFSKGLMEGYGLFTTADGLTYEGEFLGNIPMGKGTYTWPDGSSYEGDVYNAVRHGVGTYWFARNGAAYMGQWHEGVKHGKGTMYYNQDKTSWYKGDWEKNRREGVGDRCYPSGNLYSGEWKNSLRDGAGTMRWVKLGQQYEGEWKNGEQHGKGTHVWILRRSDGSQYSQSNRYKGDFVKGQRHGWGTFYYADGSFYEGEWKNNKKHGQGTFTATDGRVSEDEFVDDKKVLTNTSGDRRRSHDLLRTHIPFSIVDLLNTVPEGKRHEELQQVECVLLREYKGLRSIYTFYSRLGRGPTPDNTFQLSQLQLWRLLKDCNIHHHGITLSQVDHVINKGADTAELPSPFAPVLFHKFLNCLVTVAFLVYSTEMMKEKYCLAACLSKLLMNIILPNAKNVKGFVFRQPSFAVDAMKYTRRCWEVYQRYSRLSHAPSERRAMTCRRFLWLFKDLGLLDDNLTTLRFMGIITAENGTTQNLSSFLDVEITFLEFFEVLLGCAETQCQQPLKDRSDDGLQSECEGQQPHPEEPEGNLTQFEHQTPESMREVVVEDTGSEVVASEERMNENSSSAETELKLQTLHQFFNQRFFPAVDHHQEVTITRNMTRKNHRVTLC